VLRYSRAFHPAVFLLYLVPLSLPKPPTHLLLKQDLAQLYLALHPVALSRNSQERLLQRWGSLPRLPQNKAVYRI
jgi:hypothetical protein